MLGTEGYKGHLDGAQVQGLNAEESEGEGLMLPLANVLQEEVSAKASWHLDGP